MICWIFRFLSLNRSAKSRNVWPLKVTESLGRAVGEDLGVYSPGLRRNRGPTYPCSAATGSGSPRGLHHPACSQLSSDTSPPHTSLDTRRLASHPGAADLESVFQQDPPVLRVPFGSLGLPHCFLSLGSSQPTHALSRRLLRIFQKER